VKISSSAYLGVELLVRLAARNADPFIQGGTLKRTARARLVPDSPRTEWLPNGAIERPPTAVDCLDCFYQMYCVKSTRKAAQNRSGPR
jgi:hypothetical protein